MWRIFRTITLFFGLFLAVNLSAQGPPPGVNQGQNGGNTNPNSSLDVVVDTSIYFYLYGSDPGKYYPISDTLLGNSFYQYDPIRQEEVDKVNLGNFGTAHRDIIFNPKDFRGITLGIDQYDAYRITPEKMRFYRVQQAYSRMGFSQGSDQEETLFAAELGRNFDKGLSLSINFNRHNNQGAYDNQRAIDSAFGLGLWYMSKRGRYESFFTYTANSQVLQENGGISFEQRDNLENLVETVAVPTYLTDANSRYDQSIYNYEHYLHFFAPRDTSGQLRSTSLGISHQIRYSTEGMKFYDEAPTEIEDYYKTLATDTRGLRNFTRLNTLENSVDLFLINQRPAADKEAPPVRKNFLRAGLVYDLHTINQEPTSEKRNNLFLRGRWDFTPGPAFRATAYAHLGFLSNIGDFKLSGEMATAFSNWFQLEGRAVLQQRSPTLLEERQFVSQQLLWEETFKKHTETLFEGTLIIPKTKTRFSLGWTLSDGYIYFDTLSAPIQLASSLNVLRVRVDQSVRVWKFYLDNQVLLQPGADDILGLPSFYSKHSLYFEGYLFRDAMLAKIGLDLRLIGPHKPLTYQPVTGQFIQTADTALDWQPLTDAFIAFKVTKFRFFFRLENIIPVLTQEYTYLIGDYPVRSLGIRFGLSWQFVQ